MNATQLLTKQHAEVKELLERLDGAKAEERRELFEKVASKLAAHDAIERQLFYPAVEKETGLTLTLGEAIVEHGLIEFMLYRADRALTNDEFPAEAHVLKEMVLHHAQEEEKDLFPEVEKKLDAARLDELGEAMQLLFDKELKQDFRVSLHDQLQQVLTGGMKTKPKNPRRKGTTNGSKARPSRAV